MKKIFLLFFALMFINSVPAVAQMAEVYNSESALHKNTGELWKVKKGTVSITDSGEIKGSAGNAVMFYSEPVSGDFELNIDYFKTYYNGGRIFFYVCSDEYNSGIKDGYAVSWENQNGNKYTFKLSKYVDYNVEKEWEALEFNRDRFAYDNKFRILCVDGILTLTVTSNSNPSYTAEKTFDLYEEDTAPFLEGYVGVGGGSECFILKGISVKKEQGFIISDLIVQEADNKINYSFNTFNYTESSGGVTVTALYDAAGKMLGSDIIGWGTSVSGDIDIPEGYIPSYVTVFSFSDKNCFVGKNSVLIN